MSIGAIINTVLLEPVGRIVSLDNSLRASAHGCNNPNKPTTFGPFLNCIKPIILLSASVRYATNKRRGNKTIKILSIDSKNAISEALNQSISELVVTTMMAQNFHWNVTGMAFGPLHELFQKIYEDHFEAQDELAERIKAIGGHANGMLSKMVTESKVLESDGKITDKEMIKLLADAETTIASTLSGVAAIAEKSGDLLTQDLAITRGQVHEKFAWLLNSHLR